MRNNLMQTLPTEQAVAFMRHMHSVGIDQDQVILIDKYDYRGYMEYQQSVIIEAKKNHEYEEDMNELLNMTEDEYTLYKEMFEEVFNAFVNEGGLSDDNEFKFPYKEIFNGNFNRLDKTKLTEEQKIKFNVQGLLDECYDIYYDPEHKITIPLYYDYSTTNESFVAFALSLEKLKERTGIQLNHNLPLILFNRNLMGQDMHSPSLAPELQIAAAVEMRQNMIFYMRECARMVDGKGNKMQYQMTIGTWTILWLYCQCFNTFRCAPRQVGKTTDINCVSGGEFAAGSENTKILVAHFKAEDAGKNRKMMIDFANLMPAFLKFHNVVKKIQKNKEMWEVGPDMTPSPKSKYINNVFRSNQIMIASAGTTETTAERVGRGETFEFGINDEITFVPHAITMTTAMQLANSTARMRAEKANKRYGLHYMSTAGKLNTKHGREMYDFIFNKMCRFDIKLFEYSYEDLCAYLKTNGKKNFFNVQYGYKEMGFGEDWLDQRIAQTENREAFMTEILMDWLDVDSSALLNQKQIGRISTLTKSQAMDTFIFDKFFSITFFPQFANEDFYTFINRYQTIAIGVDLAHGTGNDSTVFFAIDMESGEKLFMFKSNTLTTSETTMFIKKFIPFLKESNPDLNIILAIELEGPGQSVIPDLTKDPFIEPLLFGTKKLFSSHAADVLVKSTTKKLDYASYLSYGIKEREVREYLYEKLLFELVDKYPYAFSHPEALNQLSTLYRKNTGRIDHKPGAHDDILIATLIAYSLIFNTDFRKQVGEQFKFYVDMSKIKMVSVMQSMNMFTNEYANYTKDEGEVSYVLVPTMINGKQYTNVEIYKVKNGRKVKLSGEEYHYELNYGALKDVPQIHEREMPTYFDFVQEEQHRSNKGTRDVYGVKKNKNKWFDMKAKMF